MVLDDCDSPIGRTPSAATLNRAAGRPAQTPSAARLAAPTANPLHDAPPPPGFREIELREVEAPGDLRVRSPSTERKEAPTEETKAPEAPDDHGPLGRRPRAGGAAGCVSMIWFVAKAPFAFVCYYGGLPALRRRGLWEALALAAATLIAGFSYLMVQCLELTSCLVGVPTITLSLLVVASGTCLPELVVAMVVARKGQATAAVSTALGSNVFDILIALGLPWAIYASAYGPVHIAHAFELTLLMALSTVVFLIISLTNAWTYTARHGYFLLVLYFLFNVYVVLDAIPQTNVPGPSGI